jgi:glycosyltransferase involved in cell wall biosynthesis
MELKILHVTQFLGIGGLEKILMLLIKEQTKANHHVELLVYDYEQSWVEYFRSEGIKVHSDFRKKEGLDPKVIKVMNGYIDNFDVIHTHDLNPLIYMSALKFLRILKGQPFPRFIHTAHGMDHVSKRPITKAYEKICSYFSDVTIGVSPAIKDYYIRNLLFNREQVVNINNGTATEHVSEYKENLKLKLRTSLGIPHHHKVWTTVARIVPLKMQHLLIEAVRKRDDVTLVLVGPSGDQNYWDKLTRNLPKNVHMLGARSDVNDILAGSDFFVSASSHEGIPVAALEAGAKNLPCLLSDIPGHLILQKKSSEQMIHFFKKNDLEDLVHKMKFLEQNESFAKYYADVFLNHIKEHFSSEAMSKKYNQVYVGMNV